MDSKSKNSCKEASHEGVTFKFIKVEEKNLQGKRLDPVWPEETIDEDSWDIEDLMNSV